MTGVAAERAKERAQVLRVLARAREMEGEFCFLPFRSICRSTGLSRAAVRRACRLLARQGKAKYGKGLWTEDGTPAGSGYAITPAGRALLNEETR